MDTKNLLTEKMTRTEIVYDLARHAHPSWYHSLLDWPTYQLRELLAYYRDEIPELPANLPRIYRSKGLGDAPERQDSPELTHLLQHIEAAVRAGYKHRASITLTIRQRMPDLTRLHVKRA